MNGTWIHLNLKTIEILKYQTQKISTCSKSTIEILEQGFIYSKLAITIVERWCRSNRVPWHKLQANIYLFKVNNIYTRIRCGIFLKLTTNLRERCQWRRLDVFNDSFKHVSPLILVFLLLNLGMYLFARLDEYNSIIIRDFHSGNSFVSNVSK